MGKLTAAFMLGAGVMVAQPAVAASSQALDALVRCRAVTDAGLRLSCYDKATDSLATALGQKSIRVLDEEDIRQTRRSLFGFSLPRLPLFADDKEDHAVDAIDGTIAQVRQFDVDKYEIRLSDNAVWRTSEASLYGAPRPGGKVHIKRGMLGNYFLSFDGERAVRGFRVG